MIGRELDERYRVLAKIGEGGMGEVYLAEHIHLGRREAIKVLRPSFAESPDFLARFRREARATNRLTHANIVAVYNFGALADGRLYLAMEYADGEGLGASIRRNGRVPVPRAMHIAAQLAAAIEHAHSRDVVHRDLKPDNLILVEHGAHGDLVKVLDFGLAKIISPEYQDSVRASAQGELHGTPEYMAPEQIEGDPTHPRIDIYSFGCVLFHMLTGEPPFLGRPMHVLNAHVCTPPPRPSERRPEAGIPPELDALVVRCLEKDPARRFASGAEVLASLNAIAGFKFRTSDSGRVTELVLPAEVPVDDLHEDTFVDPGNELAAATTLEAVHTGEVESSVNRMMLELAQSLIDVGCHDLALVVAVGEIRGLQQELERSAAESDDIARRVDVLDDRSRAREAALRFTLGELQFEHNNAGADVVLRQTIERQIQQFSARLDAVFADGERERAALHERELSLAAARADAQDEIAAQLASLETIVAQVLPAFESNPIIAALLHRLQFATQLLRSAKAKESLS